MPRVRWTGDARAHSAPATDDWDAGEERDLSDEEAKDFTQTNPWFVLVPDTPAEAEPAQETAPVAAAPELQEEELH